MPGELDAAGVERNVDRSAHVARSPAPRGGNWLDAQLHQESQSVIGDELVHPRRHSVVTGCGIEIGGRGDSMR